ncbi:MAG: dCTP deaminase [Alphaproteobacteria bacterium]|nr:dCTP deaminase [Alphaproteobacteria bacterium]
MILTDREILVALQTHQIEIDPPPLPDSYSSTAVDLTLSDVGFEWKSVTGLLIRPGTQGYNYHDLKKHYHQKIEITGYTLKSKTFLLAYTKETIDLPIRSRLAARVEGKSSIARLGVGIHITAPTIHAGFRGTIQLEMFNFGPNDIILDAGLKICQLIFEQTSGTPERGYSGIFQDQTIR